MAARAIARNARRIVLTALLLGFVLPCCGAFAAAGSDSIALRPALTFSTPGDGDNAPFGVEANEPVAAGVGTAACTAAMEKTAWWQIAGTGQVITLSTVGSVPNTVLAVYYTGGGLPSPGNRVACNDDFNPPFTPSRVSFATLRGRSYHVQVGSKAGFDGGTLRLSASAPRPPNDDRATAQALQTGVPVTVSNVGASQETGETLACAGAPFAATTWFAWTAPFNGDAIFTSSATFPDTVLTVYRAGDGSLVGCNDDAGQAAGPSQLSLRVATGEQYLLQIGAKGPDGPGTGQGDVTAAAMFTSVDLDGDGASGLTDCNDSNPLIRPGVVDVPEDRIDQDCDGRDAINFDRDRDGYNRPGDCNDNDPKIHPKAKDVPGNRVDEDCTDGPAPYPRLPSLVRSTVVGPPLRFVTLEVARAVAGSRIELRCKGPGCFKRRVIRVRKSRKVLPLLRHVRKVRLHRGDVVEIRITKKRNVGVVRRIRIARSSKAKTPIRIDELCLPVGSRRPRSC